MNDIALASKKGRRTLYTYFKSKEDIYMAVVESELDILSDIMKRVVEKEHLARSEDHRNDLYPPGCRERGSVPERNTPCYLFSVIYGG